MNFNMEAVDLKFPEGCNIILGQSHFIKTVEDLFEVVSASIPGSPFGLAFSEASGPRLIRSDGNDLELKKIAEDNLLRIAAGHCFIIVLGEAFPIQILDRIKAVPEVCSIFCATANPVQVLVARTLQGGGILGVIDGEPPTAVECEEDVNARVELMKRFGYKR
ncbi:MAG: adenosine monophosphate-protein transferase [Gemmatimonadaceae bacterium 4484_173]|nr:MAG: adenosine monophosphate-protein transferase [Gemmatimonadaceae bacterium 4484_173]